ncbi:MAG TPA: phosphoribosyl-AMP cyclohydrolase [Gammaproteobacteria bacterium]|nr:phosphoribosyl-AMP cyclohydrolase [Gammaproteobacteria bacterium]
MSNWLEKVAWNEQGLAPVITQEYESNQVLTLAWMNKEALALTLDTGYAVYWSRSRQKLWQKGEQSGHQQQIKSIHLDCDHDALLIKVIQHGGIACHTGRHHCFYFQLEDKQWRANSPILKDPKEIYQ